MFKVSSHNASCLNVSLLKDSLFKDSGFLVVLSFGFPNTLSIKLPGIRSSHQLIVQKLVQQETQDLIGILVCCNLEPLQASRIAE